MRAEVRRLVRQLDAPQLAEREAAEAELLRRGPAISICCRRRPTAMSAEVRERLGRVRQKLQRLAADAAAKASTITLRVDAMPLTKSWSRFSSSRATRLSTAAQIRPAGGRSQAKVQVRQTPFWPALDRVLDQAGLSVYPFSERRAIEVVAASGESDGPRSVGPATSGRSASSRPPLLARRDLRRRTVNRCW